TSIMASFNVSILFETPPNIVKVITTNSQKIKLMATKTATKYVEIYIISFKNNVLDVKKGQ
ncbi:hypothetical protein, partial [uncultured Psychrobacter sp.]|uniref:hypothetical protein n=1 Tax=uncultured Psychrobacter sp. TaxID=259303 RepID=UPI0025936261